MLAPPKLDIVSVLHLAPRSKGSMAPLAPGVRRSTDGKAFSAPPKPSLSWSEDGKREVEERTTLKGVTWQALFTATQALKRLL